MSEEKKKLLEAQLWKIAGFLTAINKEIDLVRQELAQAKDFKKGLLQQMFV